MALQLNFSASGSGPSVPGRDSKFLWHLVRWSWIILGAATVLQFIFFPALANDVALGCVLLAWLLLTKFFLQLPILYRYPLSAFIIIGFTTTQFYLPVLFTLLEGKPVVYNLELPFDVYLHTLAALFILVLAHFFYRLLDRRTGLRKSPLLYQAGFFVPPRDLQLWLMGLIGLSASFYVHLYTGSATKSTGAPLDKFVQALTPFVYAPFFIPFSSLYGKKKNAPARLIPFLVLYWVVLFVVSIARNSRGAFMIGFTSVGFSYALGLLLGYYQPRLFRLRNLAIALLGLWLFTGPIADIGTAMVLVRQQRNERPYAELFDLTLKAFQDKEAIRLYRKTDPEGNADWDEKYLDNIFLARFSNLKFIDNSLLLTSRIREHDPEMLRFTIDHFLANLPGPFLNLLGLKLDKESVNHVSYGDFLLAKVSNNPQVLGSFLTGHFAGTGMAAFGWWYLALLGIGMVPVFLLYDKLTLRAPAPAGSRQQTSPRGLRFSLCGLLAVTEIFLFVPGESIEIAGYFLLRGWLQMILLYFLLFHFTRALGLVISFLAAPRAV